LQRGIYFFTCGFACLLYMMARMSVPILFDQRLIRQHRQRASHRYADFAFLKDAAAIRLADRLELMRRHFDLCLDIGAHDGRLAQHFAGLGKIGHMIHTDPADGFALASKQHGSGVVHALGDLPYKPESFDAVFSCLSLHWVDDLPGLMMQARRLLKPDGLLLVSLLGGNSLAELKQALAEAEQDITGGLSPRCAPMADIRDIGGLMSRAGLALPVADSDRLTVNYPHMFKLMEDLRGMGEQNAMLARLKTPTRRRVFLRAAEIYQQRFARADGQIPASFEIVTVTGWAPHESQQKPLRPGTAAHRLASALESDEKDPETGA
jgi:NADH dehydrogenase [ubiquinone] 1 alpha subcomplex assembly factor 5